MKLNFSIEMVLKALTVTSGKCFANNCSAIVQEIVLAYLLMYLIYYDNFVISCFSEKLEQL